MSDASVGRNPSRKLTGKIGEDAACRYLEQAGYTVEERNWRCRSGEIDLIAYRDDRLIFVEVRTRRAGGRFGTAAESVNRRKQQQVRETALVYLRSTGKAGVPVRFDVVAVQLSAAGDTVLECRHYEHAF
ncbi:YraN family protein [Paenibacillus sp. N4]|uniref:YraN family protein n=1 Tax=Paenibacillus vietnamensis TaxID=2590547 RepID=UPI001CD049E9|nr:YraN family protein [Paenibacillus vietnamensis]MCA0754019.1 YraN family protein [Paenibacillus vietnamensis]